MIGVKLVKNSRYKIGIFKNKEDIKFILTNDSIINITGIMGSGKTTLARKLEKDTNFKLICLDWMFGASLRNRPDYIKQLSDNFEKLYPEKNRYKCADQIYTYLIDNLTNNIIFEGRHIYRYIDYKSLKGTMIIKRTSLINSYKRAFKRDMKNKIKEYKQNEIGINQVLSRFFERIKLPILEYKRINKYISSLKQMEENKNE